MFAADEIISRHSKNCSEQRFRLNMATTWKCVYSHEVLWRWQNSLKVRGSPYISLQNSQLVNCENSYRTKKYTVMYTEVSFRRNSFVRLDRSELLISRPVGVHALFEWSRRKSAWQLAHALCRTHTYACRGAKGKGYVALSQFRVWTVIVPRNGSDALPKDTTSKSSPLKNIHAEIQNYIPVA
jgi:hypothetical protein